MRGDFTQNVKRSASPQKGGQTTPMLTAKNLHQRTNEMSKSSNNLMRGVGSKNIIDLIGEDKGEEGSGAVT